MAERKRNQLPSMTKENQIQMPMADFCELAFASYFEIFIPHIYSYFI